MFQTNILSSCAFQKWTLFWMLLQHVSNHSVLQVRLRVFGPGGKTICVKACATTATKQRHNLKVCPWNTMYFLLNSEHWSPLVVSIKLSRRSHGREKPWLSQRMPTCSGIPPGFHYSLAAHSCKISSQLKGSDVVWVQAVGLRHGGHRRLKVAALGLRYSSRCTWQSSSCYFG